MTLDAAAESLLDSYASKLAGNQSPDVPLELLYPMERARTAEIFLFLVKRVESISNQERSVRLCNPALLGMDWAEPLQLVVCAYDTPDGPIEELQPDMVRVSWAPSPQGFNLRARQISSDEVTAAQQAAALHMLEQQLRRQANEDLRDFTVSMLTAARSLVNIRIQDPDEQHKWHTQLDADSNPGLHDIARACIAMDMTLTELSYQLPPVRNED
jgi:hypothetical protein